jgi:hypothetical protein
MQLPPDLLKRLKLGAAIAREVENPPDRLPSAVAETVVGQHAEEYEHLIRTRLRREREVSLHEIVWVPKAKLRYRPVSALPIDDRLLYRALILDVEAESDEPLTVPPKSEFELMVLAEAGDPYVARGDVSSYYSYIDHALVHERIIEEAARADTADVVAEILGAFLGRSFGIPQNVSASEAIGELVLQPVADRLARAGITAFRRNDDFYLPTPSWDDGVGAIETLQAELHLLGLTLNDEKTRIWKRETLERNVGRVSRRLNELLVERTPDAAEVEEIDPYTGESKSGDEAEGGPEVIAREQVIEAAIELLEESLTEWRGTGQRPSDDHELPAGDREVPDDPAVARGAALSTVRLLGRLESPAALDHGIRILRTDPGTTQTYVLSYLRRLPPGEIDIPGHVETILNEIGNRAPAWQQAWLMDALLNLETTPTPHLAEWLHQFLRSRHPAVLRVRALLVLGLHDLIEPTDISEYFDAVPPVARPDVTASMAARVADESDAVLKPFRRAGKLHGWIIDDVVNNLPDASWL